MSQQINKHINNTTNNILVLPQFEISKILKFYNYINNFNNINLILASWYQFNKIVLNFSITRLFFSYDLLIIQGFLVKKLKKRMWTYKKKRINKIRFLRKLRKSLIHRKLSSKTVNFLKFKLTAYFLKKINKKNTPLINKIPLTERVLNNSYLEFFYKFKKEKTYIQEQLNSCLNMKYSEPDYENFTVYLRNYHQKPFWKLRLARIIHWNFFFKKKALKKQRYKSFLSFFLKKYKKYSSVYIYLINLFLFSQVSWTRIQKFLSPFKQLLVTKLNRSIYLLPLSFFKLINWRKEKKKSFKSRKKIGKWSYLNYKRSQYPWLQKKKNFPKIIKHLEPNTNTFKKFMQYDPGTGAVVFFRSLNKFSLDFSEMFKANYLIKLHGYRYNV